jgi:5-(carboxyamino)imidazole ribonucleotide mutase
MEKKLKVAVLMGSKSDYEVVSPCLSVLKRFGVPSEARVVSAHRTPDAAHQFAATAKENGFGVIIGAAGKAAHLAGVLASFTTLPVIALPVKTSMMGGLDSLLSMVQMPSGIPCATVGVDAGENAGLLAVQILAVSDEKLAAKLADYKKEMAEKIARDDAAVIEAARCNE